MKAIREASSSELMGYSEDFVKSKLDKIVHVHCFQ